MAKRSRRYQEAATAVGEAEVYPLADAIAKIKEGQAAKFDESVDIAVRLGVDPKHADQMVRGALVLPHGTGKSVRILVFAKGDKEQEARDAGADHVGAEDLAKKIKDEGWLEFDRVIATPDMMSVVGRLGKILGPRGLMPNPKLGTVTPNVADAVKAAKGGEVTFRAEKAGIVHLGVGKASFSEAALVENIRAAVDAIARAKPSGAKGTYIKRVSVSTTMGPGMRLDIGSAIKAA